jgi:hypothetical protein
MVQQPLVGQFLLIIRLHHIHSEALHSVRLLWTGDQPDAQTSDNTQHSQATDIHDPRGIRTRNPNKREAADPRLRQRGHWDLNRDISSLTNTALGVTTSFKTHFSRFPALLRIQPILFCVY